MQTNTSGDTHESSVKPKRKSRVLAYLLVVLIAVIAVGAVGRAVVFARQLQFQQAAAAADRANGQLLSAAIPARLSGQAQLSRQPQPANNAFVQGPTAPVPGTNYPGAQNP